MTKWISIFKIHRTVKGVKTITIWYLNDEYEPLKEAFKALLEAFTKEMKKK